jgi:hypothetical protein
MVYVEAIPLIQLILLLARVTRGMRICNDIICKIAGFIHYDVKYVFDKAQEVRDCVEQMRFINGTPIFANCKRDILNELSLLSMREWRVILSRHIPTKSMQFGPTHQCNSFWFYCPREGGVMVHADLYWMFANPSATAEARNLKPKVVKT